MFRTNLIYSLDRKVFKSILKQSWLSNFCKCVDSENMVIWYFPYYILAPSYILQGNCCDLHAYCLNFLLLADFIGISIKEILSVWNDTFRNSFVFCSVELSVKRKMLHDIPCITLSQMLNLKLKIMILRNITKLISHSC